MYNALRKSNLLPSQVDLISCHATSTDVGDQAELNSIIGLFGNECFKQPLVNNIYDIDNLLSLSDPKLYSKVALMCTKTYIGHLLGAAGSVETAIALKCLENNIIIDNKNSINCINSSISLRHNSSGGYSERKLKTLLKNSFAFGGVNSSMVFSKLNTKD